MFYIKPLQFQLEFGLKEGGRVKATAKIDRLSVALPEWLRTNITKPGENVTAKDLGALLDGKYASDALPEWLIVNGREVSEPPEQTVADLKPGAVVFGRYRIEKELGAGGQGKLFLAESIGDVLATRSRVVLKVLHCDNSDDENALAFGKIGHDGVSHFFVPVGVHRLDEAFGRLTVRGVGGGQSGDVL